MGIERAGSIPCSFWVCLGNSGGIWLNDRDKGGDREDEGSSGGSGINIDPALRVLAFVFCLLPSVMPSEQIVSESMASFASVSRTELGRRRQQLRQQRRVKSAQTTWQTVAVSTLALSLLWVTLGPAWVVAKPEQVKVEGNQWLSDRAVRSLLRLSYPQSLWRIQPQTLTEALETSGPIASAKVTRQLFPPSLTVEVQERRPVAMAMRVKVGGVPEAGWLDAQGGWMPLDSYTTDKRSPQQLTGAGPNVTGKAGALPSLKVVGSWERYRSDWAEFYPALSRCPVKIFEINWQESGNIVLLTELGIVHLGPYRSRIKEQLRALDQMRLLPKQLDPSQIAYIDLKNPASPLVRLPERQTPASSEPLNLPSSPVP